MHELNFSPDKPINLTIAADARLNPTDYLDDQIWEINLGNTEPPAIALQTTFGLRALLCRIFPRFTFKGEAINNPAEFHHAITIQQYYPNYVKLTFKPFSWLNVTLEYWVPDSHSVTCRTRLVNNSHEACQLQVEWAELLTPTEEGSRMVATEFGLTTVLVGQTANLSPLLFLLGGAQNGKSPYPSLNLSYTLRPHAEQVMQWCHAALSDANASYELAKAVLDQNWEYEYARSARINSTRLDIITGNHEWDTAFHLSQTILSQLMIHPGKNGSPYSFIRARKPDQGYSILKDGSDYNHLWNGQTPLDTYYLMQFLLPSEPSLFKDLLQNFINSGGSAGEIDLKPGLAGQRAQLLATPLVARMAWEYYLHTQDIEILRNSYPSLLAFFLAWFTELHDRDSDGIPEWDQTTQTGFEDNPLFSLTVEGSDGVDIRCVESPDLCSYLYQECLSLLAIAKVIVNTEMILRLESIALDLKATVEQCWNDTAACYQYRDRDSHLSPPPEMLGDRFGSGLIELHREFEQPIRPLIHVHSSKEGTRPIQIYIHGNTESGAHRVDHITPADIRWYQNSGSFTSKYIYRSIEHIEIVGLTTDDQVEIQTANLNVTDETLLLPLWAHLPPVDKAKILVNLTIMNKKKFLGSYGLKACVADQHTVLKKYINNMVQLPVVSMLLEGLVQYGQRKKAAEIFTRVMKAVILSLKQDSAFHQHYHAETGKPTGPTNVLSSLIPIGTFLLIAGIKIITPQRIEILGGNPFPWPVTVKFRGLTVVHQEKKTLVIFSDGQNITVDNHQAQVITTGTSSLE